MQQLLMRAHHCARLAATHPATGSDAEPIGADNAYRCRTAPNQHPAGGRAPRSQRGHDPPQDRERRAAGASARRAENGHQRPGRSDFNPEGIPQRTLKEVRLLELGPTPWPAYAGHERRAPCGGRDLELRAVDGREEIFPRSIAGGSVPVTLRRLRTLGSTHAHALLWALDRGAAVELTWGCRGRSCSGSPTR